MSLPVFLGFVSLALHAPTRATSDTWLVQPWTHRSPSGEVALFVDPSTPIGRGKASYRLTRGEERLWQGELPYTLRDVLVLDDGSVAGYAYPDLVYPQSGDLIVAVLAPDGRPRVEERHERLWTVPHGSSDPSAVELRHCGASFALQVRGPQRGSERWWLYDWKTGRRLGEQRETPPCEEPAATVLAGTEILALASDLELAALGRVVFPWPLPLPEVGVQDERRYRQPHRVYVDWQGRVWISEFSSRVVHGFDSAGHPLLELTPDPKTFRPYRPLEWMSLRGDGHLFVCADQGVEEFGPDGKHIRWTPIEEILPPRSMYLPGRNERWVIHSIGPIELLDLEEQSVRTIERVANGRWFQDLVAAAIAPDGALAVLDVANPGVSSRDPSTWVQVFGASGEALRSLRVPDEFNDGLSTIAFDGRRIALLHGRLLLLLEEDGSPIGRMTLSEGLGEPYYLFFSPSGTELWVFPHMRHEMFRFALP